MRRVGVPGGDVCDGSFHRGYTETSQGEGRTGRETGPSPPSLTPLVSCKKKLENLKEVSVKVILMAASRNILFTGKRKQSVVHTGAVGEIGRGDTLSSYHMWARGAYSTRG